MPNTDTFTIQAGEGMAIEGDGNTFTFSSSGGGSDTASYLSTPNAGGFTTDQYGNFVHGTTTATNSWNIKSNDGTNKFQVNFESGATVIDGTLQVNNSLSVGGNADVKGNQIVIGDTNRTYAQVKFITTNYSDGFIRAYDKNEYGQAWVFKNGGSMIIGGGESPGGLYSNDIDGCADANNEQLFLSSDSLVHIYSNANTIADRKHWYFNSSGQIYFPDGTARISEDGNLYFKCGSNYGWLSTFLTNKQDKIADSGWVNITLNDGIAVGTGVVQTPQYRKIGNVVYVQGTVAFTATTSSINLFTMPSGYRPAGVHYVSAQCSGARIARIRYSVGGSVACEWIYNFGGTQYTGNMTWVDLSISYVVA